MKAVLQFTTHFNGLLYTMKLVLLDLVGQWFTPSDLNYFTSISDALALVGSNPAKAVRF